MSGLHETNCGTWHDNVEDALRHVYESLVDGNKFLLSEPYWGTRGGQIANLGTVIGWMTPDRQIRWRLDYDPFKGVHINEEDFFEGKKICHRINISHLWAMQYWRRWTSRYDKPDYILEAERELLRKKREGFS